MADNRFGDALRGLASVLNPQVAQQVAQEDQQRLAEERQMRMFQLQQAALDQRQVRDIASREALALRERQGNDPEFIRLQRYAATLPEGDPRRAQVEARIGMLTSRPERPDAISPLGRLIAERDALPQGDPRRTLYDSAIAQASTKPGVNVTVAPNISLGKEASNRVDAGLLDTTQGLMRLAAIESQFRPEFQQIGPRVSAEWASWREKLGGDPTPEQRKFLGDFSAYKRNAINSMNEYIKSITGAAMSEQEAQRILRGMPNPGQGVFDGDSPTEFKSKMDDAVKQSKLALARYEYIKRNGIALTDNNGNAVIPLDRMPKVMNDRGAELEAQIRKASPGASAAQVQDQVRALLAKEFGLVK